MLLKLFTDVQVLLGSLFIINYIAFHPPPSRIEGTAASHPRPLLYPSIFSTCTLAAEPPPPLPLRIPAYEGSSPAKQEGGWKFCFINKRTCWNGKQSPLKQEWKWFLKSSSLFVRIKKSVFSFCILYLGKRSSSVHPAEARRSACAGAERSSCTCSRITKNKLLADYLPRRSM